MQKYVDVVGAVTKAINLVREHHAHRNAWRFIPRQGETTLKIVPCHIQCCAFINSLLLWTSISANYLEIIVTPGSSAFILNRASQEAKIGFY